MLRLAKARFIVTLLWQSDLLVKTITYEFKRANLNPVTFTLMVPKIIDFNFNTEKVFIEIVNTFPWINSLICRCILFYLSMGVIAFVLMRLEQSFSSLGSLHQTCFY